MPFEFRDGVLSARSERGRQYFRFEAAELVGIFLDDTLPDISEDFMAGSALVIVTERKGKRRVHRYDVDADSSTLREALATIRASAPHLVLTELPVDEAASRLGIWTVRRRTGLALAVGLAVLLAMCVAAYFAQ